MKSVPELLETIDLGVKVPMVTVTEGKDVSEGWSITLRPITINRPLESLAAILTHFELRSTIIELAVTPAGA